MQSFHRIIPSRNYAVVSGAGVINLSTVFHLFNDLINDPNWRPGYHVLVDATNVDSAEGDSSQVIRFARHQALFSGRVGPGKTAIVASAPHVVGCCRMWEAYARAYAGREIAVFLSKKEAAEWLGVELEENFIPPETSAEFPPAPLPLFAIAWIKVPGYEGPDRRRAPITDRRVAVRRSVTRGTTGSERRRTPDRRSKISGRRRHERGISNDTQTSENYPA